MMQAPVSRPPEAVRDAIAAALGDKARSVTLELGEVTAVVAAKDYPVSGHVEKRYDPEKKRVIYQPVTIEPREITPRIIREEKYGEGVR